MAKITTHKETRIRFPIFLTNRKVFIDILNIHKTILISINSLKKSNYFKNCTFYRNI